MTVEEIKAEIAEAKKGRLSRQNVNDLAILMYVLNNWDAKQQVKMGFAVSEPEGTISYSAGTAFAKLVDGKNTTDVLDVLQEIMDALLIANPELYNAAIRRLQQL